MKMIVRTFLFLVAFGFLTACDSAEEQAEKHFQSALELIEAGDEPRAIIEFRNVFKLNGSHREARRAYAGLQRNRGNFQEAVGQYLRLVEQYPDDIDGQLALSEIYAEIGNWTGMERYLLAATELDPNNPKGRALTVVFDYRQAVADGDFALATQVATGGQDLISELPEYLLLRQVEIDDHIRNQAFDLALLRLDDAIAVNPGDRSLYAVRLSVLGALEDAQAIEAQLKEMIALFPDDPAPRATLVRWYVSQSQLDEAEKYLRAAVETENGTTDDQLTLIRFLSELHSPEKAQAELAKMIEAGDASPVIMSLQAGYLFDFGEQDAGIAQMRELISGTEPGEDLQTVKIALARMLILVGDEQSARTTVAEVLAENSENVPATKLHANWLITGDQVGDAITALRGVLEFAPRDPEVLSLLARAYQRDGNDNLVGEMLSLAMDAANKAPAQTVIYAGFLMEREKYVVAELTLVEALRLAPDNLEILVQLGQMYVATADWPRADQVRATLERIGSEKSLNGANELRARILQGQNRSDEAVAFLQGLVQQGSAGLGAHVAIIESHLTNGNPDLAKSYVEDLLAKEPDNTAIQFLDATLDVAMGANDVAEQKYRALLAANPEQVPVWVALYRLLAAGGQNDAATVAVDDARRALPDDATLKWIKAGLLESSGEIDAAIAMYEDMYALDSDNLIIANNLASLISTNRGDAASLDRAYTIARRLRSADLAAYQDTYGWIAHLRGENNEALRALKAAAAGLADDPQVQYHLAAAYLAGKRESDALLQFRRVLELTGGADSRDFVAVARREANRLAGELAAEDNN